MSDMWQEGLVMKFCMKVKCKGVQGRENYLECCLTEFLFHFGEY